jgi:hypothetical protein
MFDASQNASFTLPNVNVNIVKTIQQLYASIRFSSRRRHRLPQVKYYAPWQ